MADSRKASRLIAPSSLTNPAERTDEKNSLVTGANGHLGNRLLRQLIQVGNEYPTGTSEIFRIAHALYLQVGIPPRPPRSAITALAFLVELAGKISGKEPSITREMVHIHYRDTHTLDLAKSRTELGFNPLRSRCSGENGYPRCQSYNHSYHLVANLLASLPAYLIFLHNSFGSTFQLIPDH